MTTVVCDRAELVKDVLRPFQVSFSRCSCFLSVCDFGSESVFEVLSKHGRWSSFDNLADLGVESHTPEISEPSYSREHDIDNKPLDVLVSASRHDQVSDEPWITRRSLE